MIIRSETSLSVFAPIRLIFLFLSFHISLPLRVSLLHGAREYIFLHGFSPSLCPAVGSARSCTPRELRATFISRARKPRILSFNLTTREGQGSGTKGSLCGRTYRLVACFRSGRLNSPPLCSRFRFNVAAWIRRTANRDDCINSPMHSDIRNNPACVQFSCNIYNVETLIYLPFCSCNIKIYLPVYFWNFLN